MSSIIFVRNGVIKVFLSSSYQAETNSRPSKNTLDQSTLRRCRSLLRRSRSVQQPLCCAGIYVAQPGQGGELRNDRHY
jgi:hypothetical protein